MKMKNNPVKFGEDINGYTVPVLNEREIRAAAGIMFLALLISFMLIVFEQNFLAVKYVIVIFFTDFIIRVFVSPRFSPVLIVGRLIVNRQVPEYVGAPQKKFAWQIGVALSGMMFFLLVILNSYSIITVGSCLLCLVFLFFESAFGICLGCFVYDLFHKHQSLYCPGEACEERSQHTITKTSAVQLIILLASIVCVLLAFIFFNDRFHEAPRSLKEIISRNV
jgi:hypothetical protein